jgi:hypothetical protein
MCWGTNDHGNCGQGNAMDGDGLSKPTEVIGLSDKNIVSVVAGGWFCLALSAYGTVYSWGRVSS